MNSASTESIYSATIRGELHHYSLFDGTLGYCFGASDAALTLKLRPGGFTLRKRLQTHPFFRGGLVLLLGSVLTLGSVFAKEATLAGVGVWLYVLGAMFVVGLVLVIRFRAMYHSFLLLTITGEQLIIYRDPRQPEHADAFLARLKALA
jgi:hypothetical protein